MKMDDLGVPLVLETSNSSRSDVSNFRTCGKHIYEDLLCWIRIAVSSDYLYIVLFLVTENPREILSFHR